MNKLGKDHECRVENEVSQVEALVNRLDVFLFLVVVLHHSYRISFPPVMPVHKHVSVEESEGYNSHRERTQRTKRDGGWSAYIIWAPRSLARPKPGQRRVSGYATIWGAKLVASAVRRGGGGGS